MFGKYFLICLGIDNVMDDFDIKIEKHTATRRDFMSDELYVKLDKLKHGLSVIGKEVNGLSIMNGIVPAVIKLIDTKMAISDDLIILCWQYCNRSKNTDNTTSDETFLNDLLNCVGDCLTGKSNYKTRSYLYFKQFLLHSNIWYCKDNKNNKLLFNYVDELADKLLIEQKKYIKDSIEKEEKQDSENWYKLCNFNKYNNISVQFRQDTIVNGIKPIKSRKNTYVTAARISNPEYNVFAEFNDKIYLTQCLTFANENNKYFQSEMKKLFRFHGTPQAAPVKTYDRCLVKSSLASFSTQSD